MTANLTGCPLLLALTLRFRVAFVCIFVLLLTCFGYIVDGASVLTMTFSAAGHAGVSSLATGPSRTSWRHCMVCYCPVLSIDRIEALRLRMAGQIPVACPGGMFLPCFVKGIAVFFCTDPMKHAQSKETHPEPAHTQPGVLLN